MPSHDVEIYFNISFPACSQKFHRENMAGGVSEEWDVAANLVLVSRVHFDFISLRVADGEIIVFKKRRWTEALSWGLWMKPELH